MVFRILAASAVLLLAAGCPADPEPAAAQDANGLADLGAAELPSDPDLPGQPDAGPPSPLYAHHVDSEEQLIGGPGAYGQAGRAWLIGNQQARFLIQDVGAAAGSLIYGGNLIDADLVRPAGEPGNDRFRETFPAINFRVLIPDAITVENDGSEGVEAVLRVTGEMGPTKIIDLLDTFADATPLEVVQDYIVRPNHPWLLLRTLITNPNDTAVSVVVGDFLAFGDQLRLLTPDTGFISGDSIGKVSAIVGRGEGVSYGYAAASGEADAPFVDESGTAALLDYGLIVQPGETRAVERYVVVGDGSPESVVRTILTLRGADVGHVSGVVRDAAGAPVEGVYVNLLPVDAAGEGTHTANQALTDGQGAYRLTAVAGVYQLIASGAHRNRSSPQAVTITVAQEATADLTIGESALVTASFTGDGPRPLGDGTFPVKVSLAALEAEAPDERLDEHGANHGQARVAFLGAGLDSFAVKPGRYRVVVSHGPEFEQVVYEDLTITDGALLEGHLARTVDTTGWVACDFHQHTIGSLDADSTLEQKVRENLTAGMECVATTDHDNLTDIGPTLDALGANPALYGIVGNEISVNLVGHFNSFPLPIDPATPMALVGSQLWAENTIAELFAELRALPGERTILINHPRASSGKGYFGTLVLDPWSGETGKEELPSDFDGIEVNADLGGAASYTAAGWATWAAESDAPVLADWFGFLNRGKPVCAIGNSDSHDVGDDAGYPRTVLRLGTDDPMQVTDEAVVAAIAAQRAIVSRGAWLQVHVGDEQPMGHTEVVDGSAGSLELRVVASVPSWLALDTVELYANGLLLEARATGAPADGGVVWFDDVFSVTPELDTWYVVLTRGSSGGQPVFGGSTYAFTNPIYVDVDGGDFAAPGPVELPP